MAGYGGTSPKTDCRGAVAGRLGVCHAIPKGKCIGEGETPSRHNTKHANTHSRPLSAAAAGCTYRLITHHDQPSVCGGSRSCLLVELTADLQQPPRATPPPMGRLTVAHRHSGQPNTPSR